MQCAIKGLLYSCAAGLWLGELARIYIWKELIYLDMRKIVGEEKVLFKGRFTEVREYALADDGKDELLKYECVRRKNSVCAIVFNPETEKYFFVKQFRVGAKKELVELVAGMLDQENEDPETAIVREIEEELGYAVSSGSVRFLDDFYSSPGGFEEKMFLYYAEVSKRINNGGGVDDESIVILELSRDEVVNAQFEDAKTVIGQLYIKQGSL